MLSNEFTISYSPKDEIRISKLAKKIDLEDLNSIKEIEENIISFRTIYIYETDDSIEAKVFIINPTDIKVNFEYLPFKIVNSENDILGSEYVKVDDIGEIPPKHIRPYSIFFSKNSLIGTKQLDEKCSVMIQTNKIDTKTSNKTTIQGIDERISLYDRRIIEKYIENMPPIIENKFKIIPYNNGIDEDGNKFSIIILSNGYDKNVELTDTKMIYKDEGETIQAKKRIEKFPPVMANSTFVIKIVLENQDIINDDFNPEKCKLTFA